MQTPRTVCQENEVEVRLHLRWGVEPCGWTQAKQGAPSSLPSPCSPGPPSPASRPPALTIQRDAGVGVPKLVHGHTSVVPIILL